VSSCGLSSLKRHSRTLAQPAALSVETANRQYSASGVRRVTLSSSDVAAIRGAEKALADAFEAADPTAWVDFYTEDATFVGPGMPAIEGRDGLLAARSVVISSMEIVADSTIGAGDFAATQGRGSWVSGPRGSDGPRVRRRFLMVWRRDADGRWRIARELLNEDV
jgi:ketosteroid isomerase-like protein